MVQKYKFFFNGKMAVVIFPEAANPSLRQAQEQQPPGLSFTLQPEPFTLLQCFG
jgi:hypothetical protein